MTRGFFMDATRIKRPNVQQTSVCRAWVAVPKESSATLGRHDKL